MGTKLLLADDSITIQKVVGIIFAGEDYELVIVDNGDAALAKARDSKPDVLLVDAVMPGKTGYEVCEEVRRDPALQGVPILLLTGAFEPFDEEKVRQSGADDFISKPFESQNLIDKVTTLADLGTRRKIISPEAAVTRPSQVVPPVVEKPVPPPSPQPAPVAPPSAPAAAAVNVAPAEEAQFAVEMVEGTADDDLWGAFELEEVAGGDAGEFGAVALEEEASFAAEPVEEPFSFAEESPQAPQPAAAAPTWDTVAEDAFVFEEETVAGGGEEVVADQFDFAVETSAAQEFEAVPEQTVDIFAEEAGTALVEAPSGEFDIFAEEPSPVDVIPPSEAEEFFVEQTEPAVAVPPPVMASPSAAQELDLQFAPEEEYVPVAEAAPAAVVTPTAAGGASELSEEQLAAMISRVSRDIIEKIAWEVVPDLAERIIQEEIRKIKAGL
ncbi:MAG TPA: response regulator [Geobacteraceae bacterium]|nr:response regulator [Geobacteraceae bacterium]